MSEARAPVKFGTFTGVFTPTLLTILGVIMYVRIGWVVGNAGLLGAWLVMGVAMLITACTGLSLSSIATNTRIGHGGPYAIMSRSLGLEVGGSIGIPLYLTRPLGVAMYVFGFREGVQWVFPNANGMLIDLAVFAVLFGIAYRSAELAFKTQYIIMAIIAVSLVSVFVGEPTFAPATSVTWWGDYPGFPEKNFEQPATFWQVFAVFFPATTGILAGANMSGDLEDPRRAIPVGTLSAIGLSSVVYFFIAWWCARAAPMDVLASNYNVVIDTAWFGPAVLAGLLGATFSSALAGLVGGPRILMAMGQHQIIPYSDWLAKTEEDGEPRNAMLVTGVLTFGCLMFRDLNVIAPLVTMFFLITYCVLNVVVLAEQLLGLVSFRPTLRIPMIVPAFGMIGCVFTMFIVSPAFGLISVAMVASIYAWIQRTGIRGDGDDVRSSVFVAVAEWAATHATDLQQANVRAWKPALMVPVEDPHEIRGEYRLLMDVVSPEGSIKLLGLATTETVESLEPRVIEVTDSFRNDGILANWSVVDSADYMTGTSAGLQALQSAFFRPNLLYLTVPDDPGRYDEVKQLIRTARKTGVGAMMVGRNTKVGLGQRKRVTLWVQPHPDSWEASRAFEHGRNLNLTLLMGYRLMRTWDADLTIITVVREHDRVDEAQRFLRALADLARVPQTARREVMVGSFEQALVEAPVADLTILGLQPDPDFDFVNRVVSNSHSTCLFVADSGRESALA